MGKVEKKSGTKQGDGVVPSALKAGSKKAVAKKTEATQVEKPAAVKRVRNYKNHAKKELSQAFPAIVDTLIKQAKKGSLTHTKFLFELGGGKDKPVKRDAAKKEPSFVTALFDAKAKIEEQPVAKDELAPAGEAQ
jgi:hypothetical protein